MASDDAVSDDRIVRLSPAAPAGQDRAAPRLATPRPAQAPVRVGALDDDAGDGLAPAPVRKATVTGPKAKTTARSLPGMTSPTRRDAAEAPLVASPAQRLQVSPAQLSPARRRYRAIALSFVLLVILPTVVVGWYLFTVARDQFHSTASFSIRSEEMNASVTGLLGALASGSSGTASDPDIIFEYIRSQDIVADLDQEIGLRGLYEVATDDPWFSLAPGGTIEDLYDQWMRMVDVIHESSNGIITIEARAFTAGDAQAITQAIVDKSSTLVNRLSQVAHADTIRFAEEELGKAEAALFEVRQRLTVFRRTNQIVDPQSDAEGQLGILNALQTELARALIDRDTIASFAQPEDPRLSSADSRIDAIEKRIAAEREALQGAQTDGALDIFSQYETLLVEQEFAQASYTAALAAVADAQAQARRQARYIAVHVTPTLAEQPLYPRRIVLTALTLLFAALGWAVLMLAYYNIRDNR